MKHAIVIAVVLALTAPVSTSAQKKADAGAKTATSGTSPKKGDRKNPGSAATSSSRSAAEKKGKKDAKEKKETAPPVNPGHLAAVNRSKSVFIFAMESCDRPDRCDPSLRDESERRFLEACRLCASAERCEAERDTIRAGQAKRRANPCLE